MTKAALWLAVATAAALAMTAVDATAQTLRPASPPGRAAVPGEIVVGFRAGVSGSERAAARSVADVRASRSMLVRGAQLERRPDVRYAEPNWIYYATATTPDDPLFGSEWGLNNTGQAVNGHPAGTADADIDAPEAWDRNRGSASTVVAVVDSGVAYEHPDLAPNMWTNPGEIAGNGIDDDGNGKVDDVRGWDFAYNDNDPWDYNDHGTHVAGTIAARGNNGLGVAGVAWQASIMPVQALNADGGGTNANIADAFAYAADNGAKVVNASLGGPVASQAMTDAITGHPGALYVVAAGNSAQNNDTTPSYPCNITASNLICVAATDDADNLAGFSNYGALSVDLAAPGVDIESTRPHNTDAFNEDFETSLDNWTIQSGPWGRVGILGTIWLTDSPIGNYADNADWAIRTTSKVDLGTRGDCALKMRFGTFLENGVDWLDLQSSTDGTTWSTLLRIGDTNGAVRSTTVLLGAAGSRYYRYRLTSDASINKNGVFIDSVRIACPGGTYGASDYQFLDGTSMASPHVAGAAAVLFSDTPTATVAEVRKALLDSGDPVAALSGKTVTGRRLNLAAALAALIQDTTTTITSDAPDPSVVGQPVTVAYSVANKNPAAATPTGNVTVTDGATSCTGTVAAGQCSLTFTTPGTRSLTATYAGDASHRASPASAPASHQVNKAGTTTALASDSPDPSVVGQQVTVQYGVAVNAPGAGTPTGNVTVSDGTQSCTASAAAGQCSITFTTAGAKSLTAVYSGDANFSGSTSTSASHTVDKLATTTAITSDDPDPSVVGQAVTVQYGVTTPAGGGTPTGNVTVTDGVSSCTGTVAAGQCAITFTSPGSKSLTATYAGDATHGASPASAAATHQVNKAATTSTVTSDDPDPSVVGQAVTVAYGVAVDAPGAGTPAGNVTVSDGAQSCTGTVAAGQCSITFTTAGARSLTATYAGNASFTGSTSATASHTVSRLKTTTAITADAPDPSPVGEAVSVSYDVAPVAPGAGTLTGTVTVSDGVDSCSASVAAGSCSIKLTNAGARTLTASYAGTADFEQSTSAGEPHAVAGADTATTIESDDPDASVAGQPVTVTYDVTSATPGTPAGNVTVGDGTTSCTATVAAGQCTLTFKTAGARSLTATYTGGGAYNGSTSAAEPHAVGRADTKTTITGDGPDPSAKGKAVTVSYAVSVLSPGAGTPTGAVTVTDGVSSCAAAVAAGKCTITLTTAGSRTLKASYAGDPSFRGSTSGGAGHTVTSPGGPGGNPPPPPPPLPPPSAAQISGAHQTHPRFRVSPRSKLARVSRRRAPIGTTFTYALDRAASVRFDFIQPKKGRKVRGTCVPAKKRNRTKPKCTLTRGTLSFAGHEGLNTVRFKGWLSRKKRLTPGKYTLVITAVTPGVGETSQRLHFRVVR